MIVFSVLLMSSWSQADSKEQKKRIKKRVAVFIFDDKTDKSWRWWNNKGVGEGIAEMLTTALVKTGNYRVIERRELDQILKEQDLGASGIVTPQSAAKIGKVLGVELAVMGAVTELGYKKSDIGGRIKGIGLGLQSQSATVGLDCRKVNITTAEIVAADNVRKEKSSKGIKVSTPKLSFTNRKAFDESLVGKAAREAVKDVIKLIVDPDTGLSLGSMDTKVGAIKVTNPNLGEGKASQCSIVSGSGFNRGDFVRIE